MAENSETDTNISTLRLALGWYQETFNPEISSYETAVITHSHAASRYWFAGGDIHCHAGNMFAPTVKDGKIKNGRVTRGSVEVGEVIAYSPVQGIQGRRAFRWARVADVVAAYNEYIKLGLQ